MIGERPACDSAKPDSSMNQSIHARAVALFFEFTLMPRL